MPYKDPKKQREAMRKIRKKWEAEHPERLIRYQFERHQKKKPERVKEMRERRRQQGTPERPKGPRARTQIVVPASKKWRIFTDKDGITRVYFTSNLGFELKELSGILREFKDLLKNRLAPDSP